MLFHPQDLFLMLFSLGCKLMIPPGLEKKSVFDRIAIKQQKFSDSKSIFYKGTQSIFAIYKPLFLFCSTLPQQTRHFVISNI